MSILTHDFANRLGAKSADAERIEPTLGAENTATQKETAVSDEKPDATVFDFTSARKTKLESDNTELSQNLKDLIRAGTMTSINLKRVERTVLGLVGAFSTDDLLKEYASNVAVNMSVDFVSLCLESESGRLTNFKTPGVYWLTPGSLDAAMHGERLIMSANGDEYARVFGSEAFKINSCSLIRLEMPEIRTRGVLAFGAKAGGYFSPEQGTELVEFLGAISEKLLTRAFMNGFTEANT